jgi:hypothetical protein
VKGSNAPKNAGKALAHPEQGPGEKNFRYLKAGILPSVVLAMEVLNARQANAGSKVDRGETRNIRVATYSPGAVAPGIAVKAARAKVADFADSNPKELL